MAKSINTAVLDAGLDVIATATKQVICSAQPTTYVEANATFMLANVVMAGGDYTKAAGDVSGRKVTAAAKAGVSVTNSGTATHAALIRTADSTLIAVTTCTSQALTSGNQVNIPAWDYEFNNPT